MNPRNKVRFISFRGKLKSGKTTAAEYLVSKYPGKLVKIAFADSLKSEVFDLLWRTTGFWSGGGHVGDCKVITQFAKESGQDHLYPPPDGDFPTGLDLYYVSEVDKLAWVNAHKREIRSLLQWYGTEYRRTQDENYWINRFLDKALAVFARGQQVVVDDCRFDNERWLLKEYGCLDVWVRNTEQDAVASEGIVGHASEAMVEAGALVTLENVPSRGLDYYHNLLSNFFEHHVA